MENKEKILKSYTKQHVRQFEKEFEYYNKLKTRCVSFITLVLLKGEIHSEELYHAGETVKRLFEKYPLSLILGCAYIALKYDDVSERIEKLGGICYNKNMQTLEGESNE